MTQGLTPPDNLTEKRAKLLKSIRAEEDDLGNDFARSQLNAVLYYNDMSDVIGEDDGKEEDTLQTTTKLLNKIQEEDGYLKKTQQGGENAFVIDTEASEEAGEKVTGVNPSELTKLAFQVLDRHGISDDLSEVDFADWGDVISSVNSLVGKRVLMVKSEPNEYRLVDEAREIIDSDF